jgi:hypothetical protein
MVKYKEKWEELNSKVTNSNVKVFVVENNGIGRLKPGTLHEQKEDNKIDIDDQDIKINLSDDDKENIEDPHQSDEKVEDEFQLKKDSLDFDADNNNDLGKVFGEITSIMIDPEANQDDDD